jgi:signal transduction histidine kinase
MKGLDKDWTYLNSNRKAYFTDLSPGNYTFIVQAESNVGTWTGKETRLFIRILPPIWKSAGAYIFYLVCIALILWLSVRYYHRYHKNKTLNKLRLFRHEKEKEIYQARIEFFTNIAHEIQTPLTLILGPLELLIKKIDELPSIKKNLLMMNKNGQRLLELTNQLLDFRRTEVDQFGLSFVNTVIPDLLHERIDVFRPEAEKAGITIATGFPDPHFEAFVDREAFIKICDNLLSNAIKYGNSNISISMPSNPSSGQSFIVRFINDGKGIPLDTAEKIFEPFFRLPHNDKPGTGIGLSLARSLAELHNGTLHLVSGETGRIIFELTLPVHQKIEFQLSKWKNIPQNEGHHFDS